MKHTFVKLTVSVLLVASASGQTSIVQSKYDRFEKQTTISAKPIISSDSKVALMADITYPGEVLVKPALAFRILIVSTLDVWPTVRTAPPLKLMVNGDRLTLSNEELRELGLMTVGGRTTNGFGLTVNGGEFKSLACARSVEVKFGLNEFELTPSDVANLKALLVAGNLNCE